MAREHHPDVGGDEEKFKEANHAYKMLTDPSYRHREEDEEAKRGNTRGDLNIVVQVPVKFEDAFFGREVIISYNRLEFDEDNKPLIKEELDIVTEVVDLPAGSCNGFEHLMREKGHTRGDHKGDARAVIQAVRHPSFQVQGYDVIAHEVVPLALLIKGGSLEVPTMWGIKKVKISPGHKPDKPLRVTGAGVREVGDHVVKLQVKFPEVHELKSKEWSGLELHWDDEEEEEDDGAA